MAESSIGHHSLARLLAAWGSRPGPLVSKLADALVALIRDGRLPAGTRLPSERALAAALGVSRNTVAAAFDELRASGALISRRGAGTFVTRAGRTGPARGDDRLVDYAITPTAHSHVIDLRSAALPGLELVNDAVAALDLDELRPMIDSHGYLPRGLGGLRAAVADYYTALGLPTSADEILITSGAQQGVRLATQVLVEPGARVLVEDPTFRGALDILRSAGIRAEPGVHRLTPLVDAEVRAAIAQVRPSLIMVQSVVHNPLGTVMSAAEKRILAGISEELEIPVIDDVALLDSFIGDAPPRPLAAYGGKVITVGSASKSFWGGLRIGWLRAEPQMVSRLAALKAGDDLGTSVIPQIVTEHLLDRIDEARLARNEVLEQARRTCLQAVRTHLPGWATIEPQGGASLWVQVPRGSATTLTQHAVREGVLLFAGPVFSATNGHDDYIRISYSGPADLMVTGIQAIARAWQSMDVRAG